MSLINCFSRTCDLSSEWSQVNTIKEPKDVKNSFYIIKINPFQPIFCEIPVSFEMFRTPRRSLQIQVGYIFPRKEGIINQIFYIMGEEGLATDEGIFSYRNSPYINDAGINFKTEVRFYSKEINSTQKIDHYRSFYYAPQMTYKFCFYKNQKFEMHYSGFSHYQTESKYSHILGIGIMIGVQSINHSFITDWYGGVGLRSRLMFIKIHEIYSPYPLPGRTSYPNTNEKDGSIYPFVNLGIRIGFKL